MRADSKKQKQALTKWEKQNLRSKISDKLFDALSKMAKEVKGPDQPFEPNKVIRWMGVKKCDEITKLKDLGFLYPSTGANKSDRCFSKFFWQFIKESDSIKTSDNEFRPYFIVLTYHEILLLCALNEEEYKNIPAVIKAMKEYTSKISPGKNIKRAEASSFNRLVRGGFVSEKTYKREGVGNQHASYQLTALGKCCKQYCLETYPKIFGENGGNKKEDDVVFLPGVRILPGNKIYYETDEKGNWSIDFYRYTFDEKNEKKLIIDSRIVNGQESQPQKKSDGSSLLFKEAEKKRKRPYSSDPDSDSGYDPDSDSDNERHSFY